MREEEKEASRADDLDERVEHIARAVKDYLREGEGFLIQCQEDEILVEEALRTRLQREHPRLVGRLLSMEDQLETGCSLTIALFALGGVVVLGLHVGWWDDWLPANVGDALKGWWFYLPLFVALFFLSDILYARLAKRRYRRGREELLQIMRDEGFERDTLVPIIKDAPEFEKIAKQLKLDAGPFRNE